MPACRWGTSSGRRTARHDIFYQMMIPERMTSAAGALGWAGRPRDGRPLQRTGARPSARRSARFEGVSFKVAESITLLDSARSLVLRRRRADRCGDDPGRVRRLVSESKKFATEAAWSVVNHAMQILGGIGYTGVYPIERLLRDARLALIWTGTNEIMDLVIQHEYYREFLVKSRLRCGIGCARDGISGREGIQRVKE